MSKNITVAIEVENQVLMDRDAIGNWSFIPNIVHWTFCILSLIIGWVVAIAGSSLTYFHNLYKIE